MTTTYGQEQDSIGISSSSAERPIRPEAALRSAVPGVKRSKVRPRVAVTGFVTALVTVLSACEFPTLPSVPPVGWVIYEGPPRAACNPNGPVHRDQQGRIIGYLECIQLAPALPVPVKP